MVLKLIKLLGFCFFIIYKYINLVLHKSYLISISVVQKEPKSFAELKINRGKLSKSKIKCISYM